MKYGDSVTLFPFLLQEKLLDCSKLVILKYHQVCILWPRKYVFISIYFSFYFDSIRYPWFFWIHSLPMLTIIHKEICKPSLKPLLSKNYRFPYSHFNYFNFRNCVDVKLLYHSHGSRVLERSRSIQTWKIHF